MDVKEQLQAYTTQIVALGQATLARHRRGEWLPDELATPAAALLALEGELGATPPAAAPNETVAPAEAVAAPGVTAILDESIGAPQSAPPDAWPAAAVPEPAAPVDEPPDAGSVAVMSPIEADNWLSALDEELPSGLLILDAADTGPADESLVIDVDERPGGGPATVGAAEALPPLVIDPIHDLPTDSGAFYAPGAATEAAPDEPGPAGELRFCTSCGATLRPGRRFCHRCGASVAEMVAELFPETPAPPPAALPPLAAPPAPPAEAPLPPRITTLPREEWPTIVSDAPRYTAGAAPVAPVAPVAMARFCNNCGLGLAADATVCPDCGSRDIG